MLLSVMHLQTNAKEYMSHSIDILGYKVGSGQPVFVIAEAGVNHNGSLDKAYGLIDAAVVAGANAVKFQTFKTDLLATPDAPKAAYQQQTTDKTETQYEMLKRLELSVEAHRDLIAYCAQKNILFMSTPFEEDSANLLDDLDVPVFKIPSGEINNLPFLTHVAQKGKPLIVSTGMSTLGEVELAVQTIEKTGNQGLVLLHCVSNYPADVSDVNLRAMQTMAMAFGYPVGYSDHTLGIEVSLAAVALGACLIEKHFTLDRTLPGPDHEASLEPEELCSLVRGIRKVTAALGHGRKEPVANEMGSADVIRKSLVAACDIQQNTVLQESHIAIKRPGTGLSPPMRSFLVGRRARTHIPAGTLLKLEMLG